MACIKLFSLLVPSSRLDQVLGIIRIDPVHKHRMQGPSDLSAATLFSYPGLSNDTGKSTITRVLLAGCSHHLYQLLSIIWIYTRHEPGPFVKNDKPRSNIAGSTHPPFHLV